MKKNHLKQLQYRNLTKYECVSLNFAKCQSNAELLKPQEESQFISSHDIT